MIGPKIGFEDDPAPLSAFGGATLAPPLVRSAPGKRGDGDAAAAATTAAVGNERRDEGEAGEDL